MGQVSKPCGLVVPVSLYRIPSQLYWELANYKRSSDTGVRAVSSRNIISILCYFLSRHQNCISRAAGGPWSVITNVPSSKTTGTHALASALSLVPSFKSVYEELLVRGPASVGHLRASDTGFTTRGPLTGERVLLIDDTFTSGARAQSAASALALSGADVMAIVPIGRVFKPGYSDETRAWWESRKSMPFDFDTCCIH